MVFTFCSKTRVMNKIRIKEVKQGSDYTITFNDDQVIHTTVADTSDNTLNNWLQEMHRLHTDEKNDNLMVILSASTLDDSNFCSEKFYWSSKHIINMLKFGVGSYCLLLELSSSSKKRQTDVKDEVVPMQHFKGFVSSNKITFVGFDVDRIMDKLNNVHKLHVVKTLDLKKFHQQAFPEYSSHITFSLLVDLVFRDELNKKERIELKYWSNSDKKIKYWEEEGELQCIPVYSHDNVKVSTVEVYLQHLIAVKCREIIEIRRSA